MEKYDYRVALAVNKGYKLDPEDLEKIKQYERERTGLELDFQIFNVDVPLEFEFFGTYNYPGRQPEPSWGLKDPQEKLRPIIPEYLFHECVFLYKKPSGNSLNLRNYTRFGELYPGTEFIEILSSNLFKVYTHEHRHAMVKRLNRRGIKAVDVMDIMWVNGKFVAYYKNQDPYASDGNYATQNILLSAIGWDEVVKHPQLDSYLKSLMDKVASLRDSIIGRIKTPKIYDLAITFIGKDASPRDLVKDGLGCAESVSTLLRQAIPTFKIVTGTWSLWDELRSRNDFKEVTDPQPGDIILSVTGTGNGAVSNGHTGIVSKDGKIMSNNSSLGLWQENYTLDSWDAYFRIEGGFPTMFFRYIG